MKLRDYAAIVTAVLVGIFSFDLMWNATRLMVEDILFLSLMAAVATGLLFGYLSENRLKVDLPEEETSRFVQLDNGLNVLIQRSKKKSPGAWQSNQGK